MKVKISVGKKGIKTPSTNAKNHNNQIQNNKNKNGICSVNCAQATVSNGGLEKKW